MPLLFENSMTSILLESAKLGVGRHTINFENGSSYIIEIYYNIVNGFYLYFIYDEKPISYMSINVGINIFYKINHVNIMIPTYIDEINYLVRFYKVP